MKTEKPRVAVRYLGPKKIKYVALPVGPNVTASEVVETVECTPVGMFPPGEAKKLLKLAPELYALEGSQAEAEAE